MIQDLNCAIFAECLHHEFQRPIPEGSPISMELIEVTEQNDNPRLEQFTLVFRGPRELLLSQGVHPLEHEKLGRMELFLVPIGPDETGLRYEAIFNRIRPQSAAQTPTA